MANQLSFPDFVVVRILSHNSLATLQKSVRGRGEQQGGQRRRPPPHRGGQRKERQHQYEVRTLASWPEAPSVRTRNLT